VNVAASGADFDRSAAVAIFIRVKALVLVGAAVALAATVGPTVTNGVDTGVPLGVDGVPVEAPLAAAVGRAGDPVDEDGPTVELDPGVAGGVAAPHAPATRASPQRAAVIMTRRARAPWRWLGARMVLSAECMERPAALGSPAAARLP